MESKIRSKFVIESITQFGHCGEKLTARPVYGDSEENKAFWDATPSGCLEIDTSRSGVFAAHGLAPGSEFYLDVIKA